MLSLDKVNTRGGAAQALSMRNLIRNTFSLWQATSTQRLACCGLILPFLSACSVVVVRIPLVHRRQTRRTSPCRMPKTMGPPPPPVMTEESVRVLIRQEVAVALREALTPNQPPLSSPPASGEYLYVLTVCAHSPKRAFHSL